MHPMTLLKSLMHAVDGRHFKNGRKQQDSARSSQASVSQPARCACVVSLRWHGAVTQQSQILESGSRFEIYPNLDRVEQPGYRMLHMGDRRQGVHLVVHLSYRQTLQKSTRMLSEGSTSNARQAWRWHGRMTVAHAHSTQGMLLHVDDTFARFSFGKRQPAGQQYQQV